MIWRYFTNHIKSILPHSYIEKCVAIISINFFLSFCTAYERRVVEFGLLPEIKEKKPYNTIVKSIL